MPQVFTSPKYQPETLQLLGTSIWVWLFFSNERIPSVNHVQLSVAGLEWPWARPLGLLGWCPQALSWSLTSLCTSQQRKMYRSANQLFGVRLVCMTLPCAHIFNASRKYPRFEANLWLSVAVQYLRCLQRAQLSPQRNSVLWWMQLWWNVCGDYIMFFKLQTNQHRNHRPVNGEACTCQRLLEPYKD